jgi:lysophospholipase L1-like esterase
MNVLRGSREAALIVASVAATLLVLEATARWIGVEAPHEMRPGRHNCLRRSVLLGLEYFPHCATNYRGTIFRTNSLGLRGPELRDDGSNRVLAVGDSCTWGWRVGQKQSYPAVLQRLLDGAHLTRRYQVINAGVAGYTSYQGLVYLRSRGLALDPRIVIIGLGFNDRHMMGDIEVELARAPYIVPFKRLLDPLVAVSDLAAWLRLRSNRAKLSQDAPRAVPEKTAQNLGEMVHLAQQHDAPVLLVNFLGRRDEYGIAIDRVSSSLHVPQIRYSGPTFDTLHPTSLGYRRLPSEVLARLQEEGWCSSASAGTGAAEARVRLSSRSRSARS